MRFLQGTGSRISGQLWWLHVVCTALLTYYAVHRKRGSQALAAIGIFPVFKGKAMHDNYCSYFQYENIIHALCNAHHLRDLIFIRDQYQQPWASKMITLLLEIKAVVEQALPEQQRLSSAQLTDFETRYAAILEAGLQACPVLEPAAPGQRNVVSRNSIRSRTCWVISSLAKTKRWLLCMILKCRLITTRPNVISVWSS